LGLANKQSGRSPGPASSEFEATLTIRLTADDARQQLCSEKKASGFRLENPEPRPCLKPGACLPAGRSEAFFSFFRVSRRLMTDCDYRTPQEPQASQFPMPFTMVSDLFFWQEKQVAHRAGESSK
jgi:hypothetical protein